MINVVDVHDGNDVAIYFKSVLPKMFFSKHMPWLNEIVKWFLLVNKRIQLFITTVKPVYNGHPWDPEKVTVVQRVVVVQRLVQNTRLSCSMFIRAGDLGWSLLTGDRCSEVAVSTGLTVYQQNIFSQTTISKRTKVWTSANSIHTW